MDNGNWNWLDSFIDGIGFAIAVIVIILALLLAAGVPIGFGLPQ